MPKYRITSGTYNGQSPGDVVEISEEQAERMPPEMFERVELENHEEPEVPMGDADPASTPKATTELPDDWHHLQQMAVVADGINGNANGTEIRQHFADYEPSEIAQIRQEAAARLED